MKKKVIKTYLIDLVLLITIFLFGVFAKLRIENFFSNVDVYQAQIQGLETGLANQSTEALLALEPLVKDFNNIVFGAYLFMFVLVPVIIYLLFWVSQTLIISKKFDKKYILKTFLYGIPFIAIFCLMMSSFLEVFFNAIVSWSSMWLFVLYIVVIFLMAYAWFTGLILLHDSSLKLLYQKFFNNILKFFILFLLVIIILIFEIYAASRYLTESFLGLNWLYIIIFILALLVLVEIVKIWYTNGFKIK